MPHLTIESSLSLPKTTIQELHQTLGQQESVSLASVKTKLYTPLVSFSGEQADSNFTSLTLKLLTGRSTELKEQIASNLLAKANELIKKGLITVEVVELGTYKK